MKIMVLSDEESMYIWEHYQPGMLKDIDLVISAGDLKAEYLSFLVSLTNLPILYVHGNHDEKYDKAPPEGCECIEDQIVTINGIRILGLGGSMRYRNGTHQYSEKEMQRRVRKLKFKLMRSGGFDILVTHAPLAGLHDGDDLCHKGFECFLRFMDRYKPKYMVHGHVHLNDRNAQRVTQYKDTKVINIFGCYQIDDDDLKGNIRRKDNGR